MQSLLELASYRQLNATFKEKSNAAFNNKVFTPRTIPEMHDSAKRLYEVAKKMTPPVSGQSAVARWLNVLPQNMTVWEKRGVSKAGALKAQKLSGYSATWILDGVGEKRLADSERSKPGAVFEAPTAEEAEMLENWRAMHDHDRQELSPEIAKRAERAREDLAKHLERLGMAPRPAPVPAKRQSTPVEQTESRRRESVK